MLLLLEWREVLCMLQHTCKMQNVHGKVVLNTIMEACCYVRAAGKQGKCSFWGRLTVRAAARPKFRQEKVPTEIEERSQTGMLDGEERRKRPAGILPLPPLSASLSKGHASHHMDELFWGREKKAKAFLSGAAEASQRHGAAPKNVQRAVQRQRWQGMPQEVRGERRGGMPENRPTPNQNENAYGNMRAERESLLHELTEESSAGRRQAGKTQRVGLSPKAQGSSSSQCPSPWSI